jgi:hypothetical protein
MPMTGYVWEQDGRIVGNASLIPFRDHGRRVYLIANVATHPDYRRMGIGRALTERVMLQARAKGASAVWLHVREDNPGAIRIYESLGFEEIARRTAWYAGPERSLPGSDAGIAIVPRQPRSWPLQLDWLRRVYPEHLSWYHSWNLNAMRPGFWNSLYLFFIDFQIKQWAAVRQDQLLGTLTWMPQGGRAEPLYAAVPHLALSDANSQDQALYAEALTRLLMHARHAMAHYAALSLDFPAGEMTEAIRAAGFVPRRTLLWMRA